MVVAHWGMESSVVFCQTTLVGTVDEVRPRVEAALKEQGFGVLTEINVTSTLKAKIGESIEPYLILGACHPGLAFKALEITRAVGLLMPCNVVLRGLSGSVEVSSASPDAMFAGLTPVEQSALAGVAQEVRDCLTAAHNALMS